MKEAVLEILIIAATAIFSGAGTFLFTRAKYSQEVDSIKLDNESKEIENLKKSIDLYKVMIDDLRAEVKRLSDKIEELERTR